MLVEDNRNAYFPRPRGYNAYAGGSLGETNDRYIQNLAYLRLKNLTVGYTVPETSRARSASTAPATSRARTSVTGRR